MTLKEVNFEELYNKEGFDAALAAAKSVEELKAVFAKEDVVLSDEEATEIYVGLSTEEGELSEDALDNVAGGGVGAVLAALLKGGTIVVGGGWLVVGGVVFVGAAALTAYVTYKRMKNK